MTASPADKKISLPLSAEVLSLFSCINMGRVTSFVMLRPSPESAISVCVCVCMHEKNGLGIESMGNE